MNTEKIEIKSMEACVVFDRCAVLIVELDNGEILTEAYAANSPEEFDQEQSIEACMKKVMAKLENQITLSKDDAKIIMALAECDLNATKAAEKIFFHRNTIYDHAKALKKSLGKDPMKFSGMCELLPAAKRTLGIKE